ncbi:peptidylprolyl isomerase [Aurantiacibacter odishensis]|uniref:peptidylprolyl isomerase n=1 Tax=Aurantiacibacter odishensis TaxID=1155476 RepID=UPI000E76C5EC|nr:peptidylprolyl isomerase [Aurantiacibacter odishensis]
MKHLPVIATLAFALPAAAQEAREPVTPASVVASASADEWVTISPEDILVMELAPDARGNERTVVIQLMSPPFSQPWVDNVRALAEAHWWDGTSVYRVQDNYVAQWGDETEERALPEGVVSPSTSFALSIAAVADFDANLEAMVSPVISNPSPSAYASEELFVRGWPLALGDMTAWPIHCYGYIGVARDYAPDTGTGAELYTIIGQPQRHMDRNLAVVGRVIEGMEHLSSLPRGTGEVGFYTQDEADLRTPIISVRLASELPEPPAYEYLASDSESFARYVEVRANRDDAFYTVPAGGVDVCSVQVPVRRVSE